MRKLQKSKKSQEFLTFLTTKICRKKYWSKKSRFLDFFEKSGQTVEWKSHTLYKVKYNKKIHFLAKKNFQKNSGLRGLNAVRPSGVKNFG